MEREVSGSGRDARTNYGVEKVGDRSPNEYRDAMDEGREIRT